MISSLLIDESPLQVLPSLAKCIGLNEAIILQQIHYWLNPKHNKNIFEGQHWVWNTYEQWRRQFPFWGDKTIRRTIANLEETGLLKSFVTRDFKKLKYYTIDYENLSQLKNVVIAKLTRNPGFSPSGQNDQIDLPKQANREARNDQIDQVKMTTSYIDTETTSENTLLLLKNNEKEFQKMISIWNDIVQEKIHPGQHVRLTDKRRKNLELFIEGVLQDKITWQDYCNKIVKTRFLMGDNPSGFKINFDWALNEDNASKLLEGAIYDKPTKEACKEMTWEQLVELINTHLPNNPFPREWLLVCKSLLKKLNQETFKSWFLRVCLIELTPDTATIQVDTLFKKDYISSYFYSDLKKAVQSLFPSIEQIEFLLDKKN